MLFLHYVLDQITAQQSILIAGTYVTKKTKPFKSFLTRIAHAARESTLCICSGATLFKVSCIAIFIGYIVASDLLRWHFASREYANSIHELSVATDAKGRFHALSEAAKHSFAYGHIDEANSYARESLDLANRYRTNWDFGNAIHDANMVLGRIAVRDGRIHDGVQFLAEAGKTPGSPQLNSFGPNMSLARDLCEKGESAAVIDYMSNCKRFWKDHGGCLDVWINDVRGGRIPRFGNNLYR